MKLQFVVSDQTNPYWNIAVENYLLSLSETDVLTLYLWRNHRTVVIGQNQNPYSEVNLDALIADGGYLMRRRTGGGAVYHDDGNLNFSFVIPKAYYDVHRQFSVVQHAVESYGIITELSGRNDVLANGRKFSGNAFSKGKYQNLHHGTILIRGNMSDLQLYLRPKPAKLLKHGVSSVRSRVVNLAELNPEITAESLAPRLRNAFLDVYGSGEIHDLEFEHLLHRPEVQHLYEGFASDEWLYGPWRNFTAQRSAQFDWGAVELQLDMDGSVIADVRLASDSLDATLADRLRTLIIGKSTDDLPDTDDPVLRDILTLVS